MPGSDVDEDDAHATRSQAPVVADAGATQSHAPAGEPYAESEQGEMFIDDPEHYAIDGRIGVGGMGTVLSAKGSRLGRPVAIKVVTVDREDLRRRFEREAQVTARLQHPAIVPVYGSGRGRSGQPFYAMKQVSGDPLDKVIRATTTLAQRIALLPKVIAVSEAIAYAHAEHVIHRDLKPANILVGGFGETVVIDWGLAKNLAIPDDEATSVSPFRAAESDGGETAVGKVMGTPAYMPIEQARGGRVDERADVYALGAILYHVLAGAPPYQRPDESGVPWESMLARVIAAAPPPLASLQPDVPPDLLAIVARAMARAPEDRYPSAGELAEDLKRFQTGQLVGAHRYSTWQLVKRWLRKHRTPVAVACVALIVLAIGGVLSVRRIIDEQARTEKQRVAAVASRGDAEDLTTFMLGDLKEKLEPLGKLDLLDDVAKKATAFYDRRGEDLDDAELAKRALARRNLGDVRLQQLQQGHTAAALAEYRASFEIEQQLALKAPAERDRQREVAVAKRKIGDALVASGDTDGALVEFRTSQATLELLATADPSVERQSDLVGAHDRLATALTQRGDMDGALVAARAALAISERLAAANPGDGKLAQSLWVERQQVGVILYRQGKAADALTAFRAASSVAFALAARDPSNTVWQRDASIAHERIALVLAQQGDLAGALDHYRATQTIDEGLAARDPTSADRQRDVLASHNEIGDTLFDLGDAGAATKEYRAGLAIADKLAATDPTNADRQTDLAHGHEEIAKALWQGTGDLANAVVELRVALAILNGLLAKDPSNALVLRGIAGMHNQIGAVLSDMPKRSVDALVEFRAGNAISSALAAKEPADAQRQLDLATSDILVGDGLSAGQPDNAAAVAQYRAASTILEAVVGRDPTNMDEQRMFMAACSKTADALVELKDFPAALDADRRALAIAEKIAAHDSARSSTQVDLAIVTESVAAVLEAKGDLPAALEQYRAAQTITNGVAERNPTNARFQKVAVVEDVHVGTLAAKLGDRAGARSAFDAGLAITGKPDANASLRDLAVELATKRRKLGP